MCRHLRAASVLWAVSTLAHGLINEEEPLGKVTQLLNDLKDRLEEDSKREGETYGTYTQWCDRQVQTAKETISSSAAKIQDIQAYQQEQEAFRAKFASEIESLMNEIGSNTEDLREAEEMRLKDRQGNTATQQQSENTIGELERAIEILESKQPNSTDAKVVSFLSVATTLKHALERNPDIPLSAEQQQSLDGFFKVTIAMRSQQLQRQQQQQQQQQQQYQPQQPSFLQTDGYSPQASGVLQALQAMVDQQKGARDAAAAKESQAQNSFQEMEQSLNAEISNGKAAVLEKKEPGDKIGGDR
jgi:hypothetical protein